MRALARIGLRSEAQTLRKKSSLSHLYEANRVTWKFIKEDAVDACLGFF